MSRISTRPAWMKALGQSDPPNQIQVDGEEFTRENIFKHDSWAATALYQSPARKIVCKFNRQHPLIGISMRWLGRWLAQREQAHYLRLTEVEGVPQPCGAVFCNHQQLIHAVAHEYVEGRPLGKNEVVPESFDEELAKLVETVHQHKLAYVDLHKRENIIVGFNGKPNLIDFQVSWMLDPNHRWSGFAGRWLLRKLQALDRYHVEMHLAHHQRLRGQQLACPQRPTWVKAHRLLTVPIRQARRWLLVRLGIRKGAGDASSEHFPEQAFR